VGGFLFFFPLPLFEFFLDYVKTFCDAPRFVTNAFLPPLFITAA